ncbi:hypothetical protein Tco_0912861, partial [Tanacetum coccineum]
EEGAKKRKLGTKRKLKAKRRKHGSSLTREDDDLKICLHIAPVEEQSDTANFWDYTARLAAYQLETTIVLRKTEEERSMAFGDDKVVKQQFENLKFLMMMTQSHLLMKTDRKGSQNANGCLVAKDALAMSKRIQYESENGYPLTMDMHLSGGQRTDYSRVNELLYNIVKVADKKSKASCCQVLKKK